MRRIDRTPRARLRRAILASVATAVLLGGTNSLSNVLGSPYSPFALRPYEGVFALEVLAAVIGTAWAWAVVAFGLGWWSPTTWLAPATGVLALVLAAAVYYVSDFTFGMNDNLETGEMAYWMAVSVAVGSVFGLLGHLARRPRWWSLMPGLAAPALIAITAYPTGSTHIQPWPEIVAWIVAVALAIAITARWLVMRARLADASSQAVSAAIDGIAAGRTRR